MILRTLVGCRDGSEAARLSKVLAAVPDLEPTVLVQPHDLEIHLQNERFGLVLWPAERVTNDFDLFNGLLDETGSRPEFAILLGDSDAEERTRLMTAGFLALIETRASDELLEQSLTQLVQRLQAQEALKIAAAEKVTERELLVAKSASPSMQRVLELAARVAKSESSVLLLGETGTGKEWLARHLHKLGSRSHRPFVPVNCAAIPTELLESELFGHEKGSFTGAHRTRRGVFELAHRGTLFLDEVGEMSVSLQAKLLRVLQDGEFRRVGGETADSVDVRVMAATNRDPQRSISDGQLRADLYYRLAVITIAIPPLRERRQDILPLFDRFQKAYALQMGTNPVELDVSARNALETYRWPGNVRELMNVAERTVILNEDAPITIDELPIGTGNFAAEELPSAFQQPNFELPLEEAKTRLIGEFEREYFDRLLRRTNGGIGEAAKQAGIDPKTVYSKMKTHRLNKSDYKPKSRP